MGQWYKYLAYLSLSAAARPYSFCNRNIPDIASCVWNLRLFAGIISAVRNAPIFLAGTACF